MIFIILRVIYRAVAVDFSVAFAATFGVSVAQRDSSATGVDDHFACGRGITGYPYGVHDFTGDLSPCGGGVVDPSAAFAATFGASVARTDSVAAGADNHSACGLGITGYLNGVHGTAGGLSPCGGAVDLSVAFAATFGTSVARTGSSVAEVDDHSACGRGITGCLYGVHDFIGNLSRCGSGAVDFSAAFAATFGTSVHGRIPEPQKSTIIPPAGEV